MIAAAAENEADIKARVLESYEDWVPELREYVEASTEFRPRPPYELPLDHKWEHKLHVQHFTLVGDASHLMTPFAGKGVNIAMEDALELSYAIIPSEDWNLLAHRSGILLGETFPQSPASSERNISQQAAVFLARKA